MTPTELRRLCEVSVNNPSERDPSLAILRLLDENEAMRGELKLREFIMDQKEKLLVSYKMQRDPRGVDFTKLAEALVALAKLGERK